MAKQKTKYVCSSCGYDSIKWQGKCPACGEWDSFKEFKESKTGLKNTITSKALAPKKITEVEINENIRQTTYSRELDRVLGGGIVDGMAVLIGGDPGIGKSTLMLQTLSMLSKNGLKCLYVSGEESDRQIRMRAERTGCFDEKLYVYNETDVTEIAKYLESCTDDDKPSAVVVDSIQTIYSSESDNSKASTTQLKEAVGILIGLAKSTGIPIFLVGHVTKDGAIAGPKLIEHMVDTVLYFEGDVYHQYRILRAIKNRFGASNEIGIFEMKTSGLEEVENPSEFFLNLSGDAHSGSSITVALEGSRPFLIEVQALVTDSSFGTPQRNCVGFDYKRLNKIIAVLEKRSGLFIGNQDVFLNITGGGKLSDPAADLSVATSLFSSFRDKVIPQKAIFVGEVGLGGEIRAIGNIEVRFKEAEKLGMEKFYCPESNVKSLKNSKIDIVGVKNLYQLLDILDEG